MAHVKDRLKQGDGVFESGLGDRHQIAQILGKRWAAVPFRRTPKTRKSRVVKGKPQTMATMPAITECHLKQPIEKSNTAQIEKKTNAV